MTPPRLGLTFVPTLPPERLRSVALAVDASGLDELWLWEDCFSESAIATASAALAWTRHIRVGIGLMPAPLRNVGLLAMELASLERMFPGRLMAGVGHGVQEWMAQVGGRVESPMTLLREYAVALRRLLQGERVSVQGRYVSLSDVALDWPPADPPPLLLGGSGRRTLALAAELGDGTLLVGGLTPDELREASAFVGTAPRSPHDVVASLIAATGPGAQDRVEAELAAWSIEPGEGRTAAGGPDAIAEAVLRMASVGVTAVSIQPTREEPDLEGFAQLLGSQVRPLLGARQK